MSLRYICGEFLWYLKGDRDDESILKYSKFWNQIRNDESPAWNSNYGYYIFNEGQFDYAHDQLIADQDSRQAVIIINRPSVMMSETKDKICTYAMSFRIRDGKLNMSVNMRSNDFILGTQIDYFQFAVVQEMMFVLLREKYPHLEMGVYNHKADSFHIYEKHFPMMLDILRSNKGDESTYIPIEVPRIVNSDEVRRLISGDFDRGCPFTNFILENTSE